MKKQLSLIMLCILLASMMAYTGSIQLARASAIIHVPTNYSTIQAAINHANPGDTILVAAGTYYGEVDINKSVNVLGSGASSTFIDGTGVTLASAGLVKITAPGNVTFDGFTVENVPLDPYLNRYGIFSESDTSGITYTISNNRLIGMGDTNPNDFEVGFYSQNDAANVVFKHNSITNMGGNNIVFEVHTGATEISYNTLEAGVGLAADSIFFMTYNGINVNTLQNISCNTFNMGTGSVFDYDHRSSAISINTPGAAYGVGDAQFTNVLIEGNTINNLKSYRRGIGFWNGGGSNGGIIDPKVENNTITGTNATESYGIDFVATGSSPIVASDATVTLNTISGTAYGIYLRTDGCAPGAQINYNNIAGNIVGLDNTAGSSSVNAEYNWWGSSTGPSPTGSGDPVNGNADTSHWLISSFQQECLSISPATVSKAYRDIGTYFTINVNLVDVTDFYGFDVNITWDNTLITLASLDNSSLTTIWPQGFFEPLPSPGYQVGAGYVRFAAAATGGPSFNGSGTLFTLTFYIQKGSNIATLQTPIYFKTVKLSNSLYTSIPATVQCGMYQISPNTPGLVFKLVDPNTAKPFVYGKTFDVQVNVTYVSSQLAGFNITVGYDTELFTYTGITWANGVLGTGQSPVSNSTLGTVTVVNTGATGWAGANGLLFTLYFQIKFDARPAHIWRTTGPHTLTGGISFSNAQLTFAEGTLPMSGISVGSNLLVIVQLIRGDVNCDGKVDIFDLVAVAHYYDAKQGDSDWNNASKYDLNLDGVIDIFDIVIVASNYGYGY
jgi:hypothetical protein